jgi:hypothetical protein
MPIKPGSTEDKQTFISRCISEEVTAGYEQTQAAAICYSKWDRRELSKQKFGDPQKRVQAKLNYDRKYEGINLAPLEKGPNDPCWENYVQVGTKEMDGRLVPNCVPLSKIEMELEQDGINLQEDYPWEQCIADQTARYGDEETAKKVCGMIRSKYGR